MRRKNGFTLVELLTVIGLMIILASFLLPALNRARQKARVAKCIATIASLQTALGMYQVDYGVYPPSSNVEDTQYNGNSHNGIFDGDPNNLVAALTATTLGGPYMAFKGADLIDNAGADSLRYVLRDSWGQAYVYTARRWSTTQSPSSDNLVDHTEGPFQPYTTDTDSNTYNIYSLGPDIVTYGGEAHDNSDWNDSELFDNEQDGDWNNTTDKDDPEYDDINSWDGARRG